jgi:hypothetical protein
MLAAANRWTDCCMLVGFSGHNLVSVQPTIGAARMTILNAFPRRARAVAEKHHETM